MSITIGCDKKSSNKDFGQPDSVSIKFILVISLFFIPSLVTSDLNLITPPVSTTLESNSARIFPLPITVIPSLIQLLGSSSLAYWILNAS